MQTIFATAITNVYKTLTIDCYTMRYFLEEREASDFLAILFKYYYSLGICSGFCNN